MDSPDPLAGHTLVMFDGVCNLCNGFVQFLIRRDPSSKFRFASLQSAYARHKLLQHGLDPDALHSVIVIEDGKVYQRSDAALKVVGSLGGMWPLARVFRIVPAFIRDGIYDVVAASRYRWFGKRSACMIPDASTKSRFLGE